MNQTGILAQGGVIGANILPSPPTSKGNGAFGTKSMGTRKANIGIKQQLRAGSEMKDSVHSPNMTPQEVAAYYENEMNSK